MADLSRQAQLQKQINDLLVARQKLIEKNNDALSRQARLAKAVNEAMQGKNLDGLEERLGNINQQIRETGTQAAEAAENTKDFGEAAKRSAEDLEKLSNNAVKLAGAVGFLKGLKKGFGMLTNIIGGAVRVVGSFVRSVFNIGKAIIAIPFKIFGGLVEMSQKMGSPAFRQGLEETRALFGDIATGSGLALKKSVYEMRREFGAIPGTLGGVRSGFGRIFGYGPEGMAKALKENTELATHLGGTFTQVSDNLEGHYADLAKYRKGLGMSTEQQALLIKLTAKSGGDIMKRQQDIANYAIQIGDAFGYSSKEIGHTMGQMFEDVKHFGGFTDKQIAQMAVQTKRLGVELSTIQGIASGFDDFESAQKNVSFLNRAFGMTVNTMDLFQEQDPVKRIQMLQKSFLATGRDINKMTRQELQYFSESVNVSEKDAKILFSKKNLQMSYNDVKKVGNKAAKKELSTAQALNHLMKQIERTFGNAGEEKKGFLDALAQGFEKGVRRSRPFYRLMRNLNMSLRHTDYAGQQLGRNFVKYFPGVKKLLDALGDFFDPVKLVPAMRDVNKAFKIFFIQLKQGENMDKALDDLGRSMQGTLHTYWGKQGHVVQMIKEAAIEMGTVFLNLKLTLMARAATAAAEGINKFTTTLQIFLADPQGAMATAGDQAGEVFGSRFGHSAGKLFKAIKFDLIPAVKRAAPHLFKGALALMKMLRGFIVDNKNVIVDALTETLKLVLKMKFEILKNVASAATDDPALAVAFGAILFGPAIAGGLISAFGAVMSKTLIPRMAGMFFPKMAKGMIHSPQGKRAFRAGKKTMKKGFGKAMGSVLLKTGKILAKGLVVTQIAMSIFDGVTGAYAGVSRNPNASAGRKLLEGGKYFVGGVIEGLTLGFISKEAVVDNLFGRYVADPIERSMYQMSRSSNYATREFAASAAATLKATKEYKTFVTAVEAAEDAAAKAGRMLKPDQVAEVLEFRSIRANLVKEGEEIDKVTKGELVKRRAAIEAFRNELSYAGNPFVGQGANFSAEAMAGLMDKEVQAVLRGQGFGELIDEMMKTGENMIDSEIGKRVGGFRMGNLAIALNPINHALERAQDEQRDRANDIVSGAALFQEAMARGGLDKARVFQRLLAQSVTDMEGIKNPTEQQTAALQKARDQLKTLTTDMATEAKRATTSFENQFLEAEMAAIAADAKNNPLLEGLAGDALDEQIKKLARQQISAAVSRGDFSGLMSQQVKEELDVAMREQNMSSVIDDAQKEKLNELEAAAATVSRIEQLKDIPKRLAELRKSLGNLDEEQLKLDAQKLVESASIIGSALTKAVVDEELNKPNAGATINQALSNQLQDAVRMKTAIDAVVGQEAMSEKTRKARIDSFKDTIIDMNDMMKTLAEKDYTLATKPMLTMLDALPGIVDKIVNAIPNNLNKKVKEAKKAIVEVDKIIGNLKKASDSEIEHLVDLAKVLNKGGTINVRSKSAGNAVTLKLNVKIGAKQLAEELIATVFTQGEDTGTRLVTSKDAKNANEAELAKKATEKKQNTK